MKRLALWAIRSYQGSISPGLPPACRFEPTCSSYGYEAIEKHGLLKGGGLLLKRMVRCHPLERPRYDPVP
jgi:putative membrane protein insertion efficiency factor